MGALASTGQSGTPSTCRTLIGHCEAHRASARDPHSWRWGMIRDAGAAIFAIARTTGWIAHGIEEYGETPMRFRPRARYIGPPRVS